MSIVSGVGLTSGIDYNSLISNLIEAKRQPIYILEQNRDKYNEKISAYNSLSSKLSTLKSAAEKLKTETEFFAKSVSVSDETKIEASATNSASPGTYIIEPYSSSGEIELASVDRRTGTTSFSSTTASVNDSGSTKVFEYTYNSTTRTLNVENGTTLEELRDAINNDTENPGVTASIINVGTNDYRLILTGDDTGSAYTVTVTSGTTLTGFTDTDFTSHTAGDAKFRIGGVDVTKSSNTITDVIPGVTFNLNAESTTSVSITVNSDTQTIKQNIIDFVNAYNDVINYVSSNSQYDTQTHAGGPFVGEATARSIVGRLKSIATSAVSSAPDDLDTLAQIGITTDYNTGQLVIDESTLNDKLSESIDDVSTIFTDSTEGIANDIYDYIDDITDSIDGVLTNKTDGLGDIVDKISDDISRLEDRLSKTEDSLRQRFASLEALLTSMSNQNSYILGLSSRLLG